MNMHIVEIEDSIMKANISPDGQMNIIPESNLEVYALSRWFDEWCNHKSGLSINIYQNNGADLVRFEVKADDHITGE
jgi:hypothetical protein